MSFLSFLKYNAMQVSGFLSACLTVLLTFLHPHDPAQTAAIVGFPVAFGNFLAGIVINARNGNGKNGKVVPSLETAQPVKD